MLPGRPEGSARFHATNPRLWRYALSMRTPHFSAALVILLAGSVALAQPDTKSDAKKPPQFAEVVTEKFGAWDADDDGTLTASEIDKACVDGTIKGAEAAAVAALKRIVRSDKYELPALTLAYLTKPNARAKLPAADKGDADREDSTERNGAGDRNKPSDAAPSPTPTPSARPARPSASSTVKLTTRPNFQRGFETCMARIDKSDRTLFKSDENPTIEHCHQGPLGDCFFVSVVGAAVKRDPAGFKLTVREVPESGGGGGGGYAVKFGSGKEIKVSPLTDAEIAISSTTSDKAGDEGLWLAVMEKAFGTLRMQDRPDRFTTESATDAIAQGGTTATVIRELTGHSTERVILKRRYRPAGLEQYDASKRLLPPPAGSRVVMQSADNPEKLAAKIRDKVPTALKQGRIVATGTGEEHQPPGISGKHAYAVLAYDDASDTLTLWNPHGNTYSPRGGKQPGLSTGYPTAAGIFELPVIEFVRIFNNVTIETDRKAGGAGGSGKS